jgi:universal stress protein E
MREWGLGLVDTGQSQRVICATDLQPRSELALRRAALVARQMDARLMVLHVVDDRQSWRAVRGASNRAYAELLSKVDDIFGRRAAAVDIAVRAGEPVDVIATLVREQDANLLVLAAPRPRRFDAVIGTTAERLLRATERPLLAVRGEVEGDYARVAVATDATRASVSMLRAAAAAGVLDAPHVSLVHAFRPPYEGVLRNVGVEEEQLRGYRSDWRKEARNNVRSLLAAAGIEREGVQVLVPAEPPLAAIQSALSQLQPELLVLGASRWFRLKRLLLGSVADGVLRSADCDVLVIPRQYEPDQTVERRGAPRAVAAETDRASLMN